jgi:hypothetical protein
MHISSSDQIDSKDRSNPIRSIDGESIRSDNHRSMLSRSDPICVKPQRRRLAAKNLQQHVALVFLLFFYFISKSIRLLLTNG